MSKIKTKKNTNCVSVRVRNQSKEKASLLLQAANKKKFGRKIKLDDLFELAINLVTDEHLKLMQQQSLTNEDRKELLRQEYIKSRGPISKDEFTGFMMSAEFATFLTEQNQPMNVSGFAPRSATEVAS